uniref:Hes family bHLH transcription factor 1 n=1 Tax=Anas zonorhyncha TaxID=75864 RepID=A0A8B9U6G1_9AVES
MPADLMEKSSASPVAATPASINATPDKPKTAAEHRGDAGGLHTPLTPSPCPSRPAAALSTDPTVLGKYRAGFSECMNEVTRFLSTCEGVNTEVRTRLLGHLASCMTQINAMNYPAPPPPPPLPPAAAFGPPLVYGGFQLLPASDGQFAFLIPSTAFAPGGAVLPLYGSPPTAATAASPPGPPPGTADSVWRPW